VTADVQLDDLYREIILDHFRKPRNKGALDTPHVCAEGMNPLCGDEISLYVNVEDGRIEDIGFAGRGCSISQASASIMTEDVKGQPVGEARDLARRFREMMTGGGPVPDDKTGDLEALQGVAQFPARVKCAMLSWNVLEQALDEGAPHDKPLIVEDGV
jgi:nitrogen fixation NifU-like protein